MKTKLQVRGALTRCDAGHSAVSIRSQRRSSGSEAGPRKVRAILKSDANRREVLRGVSAGQKGFLLRNPCDPTPLKRFPKPCVAGSNPAEGATPTPRLDGTALALRKKR